MIELGRERRRPRGSGWQEPRRDLEAQARSAALDYARCLVVEGGTVRGAAGEIGLSVRTVYAWRKRVLEGGTWSKRRGRRLKRSSVEERRRMVADLLKHGPGIGRWLWRTLWPEVARGEAAEIVAEFRVEYARAHPLELHQLTWLRAGAVWAMDHTEARDGTKRAILSVRDLKSAEQLVWEVVQSANAQSTLRILSRLEAACGLPLVLKSDNGPAFTAGIVRGWLKARGVTALLSPPYTPTYNGAVEVAGGRMKESTMWQARRSATWRDEDFESARRHANELPRARNDRAQCPEEAWDDRAPITDSERSAFLDRLDQERAGALAEAEAAGKDVASRWSKAAVERTAIRRALVAHGILQIRRRSIPLPKRLVMCARIS